MTVARRHILPFFIPHLGCPNQCIFCDRHTIAGTMRPPTPQDVADRLAALEPYAERRPELAFYGGSFTALPPDVQRGYLEPAAEALKCGRLSGIRVSTRPDAINAGILRLLEDYGVRTVELGVQSMTDEVLLRARRGHSAADSLRALEMLQGAGFVTGVQLMPGLPGETHESAVRGAWHILRLRPDMLRIYPTVVIEGTECAAMYHKGEYQPLTLDGAAAVTLDIRMIAEELGVQIIRMGLQPSDGLAGQVAAGPYHPAFGSLVNSLWWRGKVLTAFDRFGVSANSNSNKVVRVFVNHRDLPSVVGQNRQNMPYYQEEVERLQFKTRELPEGGVLITDGNREYFLDEGEYRRAKFAEIVGRF